MPWVRTEGKGKGGQRQQKGAPPPAIVEDLDRIRGKATKQEEADEDDAMGAEQGEEITEAEQICKLDRKRFCAPEGGRVADGYRHRGQ
eukprot:5846533-Alexandrium_andersonii.AAC.1